MRHHQPFIFRVTFACCFLTSLVGCNSQVEAWLTFGPNAFAPAASVALTSAGPAGSITYLSSSNFTVSVRNGGADPAASFSTMGDARCSVVSTTCSTTVGAGQLCDVILSFTATDGGPLTCTVTSSYQMGGQAQSTSLVINGAGQYPATLSVQKVYPTNGAGWNDYVVRSDLTKSENAQADTACAPIASTKYFDCVHAGEKLKVRTGKATCTGLTISETLSAFQWTCDAGSGEAIFYSNHFAMGKGLKDLLNATSWKSNSVMISLSGTPIVTTSLAAWWTTTVLALPDASGAAVALSTADRIYTYTADQPSKGYTISADKVGIVSLNGSKITYVSGLGSVILGATKFNWLEANFSGGTGVYLNGAVYVSRIHRSNFFNGTYGINNNFGAKLNASIITNSRFDNFTQVAINVDNYFGGDLVWNTTITNVGASCIEAWSAQGSRFIQVLCANSTNDGIHVKYGGSLLATSIFNAGNMGIYQDYAEAGAVFATSVVANSVTGLDVGRGFYNFGQLYSNLALVGNDLEANFSVGGGATQKNVVSGHMLVGSANCAVSGSNALNGLDNATCTSSGANLSSAYTAGSLSTAVLHTGISLNSSVKSQVTDVTNANGAGAFTAFGSITDWFRFENMFRGWGVYLAGGNMTSASRVACTSGNCSIWDFGLGVASPYKNAIATGVGGSSPAFVNGATCPSIVAGSVVTMTLEAVPRPFLTNAIEVPISPNGNHDGLCESGENCIYTPNYGADQGAGDFWTNTCNFQNGTITNVKMYAYPL